MKFLLTIFIIFSCFSSYASDTNQPKNYENLKRIKEAAMLPVYAFGFPFILVHAHNVKFFDRKSNIIENQKIIIKDKKLCPIFNELYIDGSEINTYYGKEKDNFSSIQLVDKIEPFFNFNKENNNELYLCINPTKTKIFENGCLDTLVEADTIKSNGKWFLNKIYSINHNTFAQFKLMIDDKNYITASTEADIALKYVKYKDISVLNYLMNNKEMPKGYVLNFDLSIKETCKKN